jgi:hypothetical protein
MTLTNPWFLLAAIPVFGLCVLIHEIRTLSDGEMGGHSR